MTNSDIEHMAQGYPPSHIGKDHEEVTLLLAARVIELQQERDALAADRERFAAQCAAAKIAVQYAQAAGFNCTLNTPDVDYFMNAMRAEGVEMAASDLFETTAIGHGMLMAFAAKLRANKDGE